MLFFKNHAKSEARKPVPDFFSFFKKALKKQVSIYFDSPQLGMQYNQTM